jgi:hypothetical protein
VIENIEKIAGEGKAFLFIILKLKLVVSNTLLWAVLQINL